MIKFPNLRLKSKLVLVFALICLIPTVSLVLVSHFIMVQSIDRWERVSSEVRKLLVLPMGENALEIASDPGFMGVLESKGDFSEVSFDLPEDYVVILYGPDGRQIYTTMDESIAKAKFDSLESAGFPPVDEFRPWEPIFAGEILIGDKELALTAVMSQSDEDGKILGVVVVGQMIPSAPANISRARKTIAGVMSLTAVFIFLIALWISSLVAREITEPIQKLVAGTQEIAGGNLDHRVDIEACDEVGMLADAFNQMTERLLRNTGELKRAEKAAAWKEVAQKLAHEIKNPLTPIQLCAERLQRRYHSNREDYEQVLDECTSTISEEVERLRRLLDEFSRLARMPRANPVPSDVNAVVESSLKLYGEFPDSIEIATDYAEDIPIISIDPEQMKRAFFNIIKNAVEAMEEGGKLSISTREVPDAENSRVEIEFSDTGTGIAADSMDELFTPHFSTKAGGAGLGLAIVQKIITDHGGEVTVKSEEGKGTTFNFTIPIPEGAVNNG